MAKPVNLWIWQHHNKYMKPGIYRHGASSCRLKYSPAIPAHLRGHMLEIMSIHTPESERGKGSASAMLIRVCNQATRDGKALMLMPDTPELARWYERFGFKTVQESPLLMARPA